MFINSFYYFIFFYIITRTSSDKKKEEKMAFVVEQLKKIVPKALRFIFTDKAIEKIAQKAFDKIEEYAKKQKK